LCGTNCTTIFFIILGQRTDNGSRVRTSACTKADYNLNGVAVGAIYKCILYICKYILYVLSCSTAELENPESDSIKRTTIRLL